MVISILEKERDRSEFHKILMESDKLDGSITDRYS